VLKWAGEGRPLIRCSQGPLNELKHSQEKAWGGLNQTDKQTNKSVYWDRLPSSLQPYGTATQCNHKSLLRGGKPNLLQHLHVPIQHKHSRREKKVSSIAGSSLSTAPAPQLTLTSPRRWSPTHSHKSPRHRVYAQAALPLLCLRNFLSLAINIPVRHERAGQQLRCCCTRDCLILR